MSTLFPVFNIGDKVTLYRWNKSSRRKMIDPCTVTKVEPDKCESGYMITVKSLAGQEERLDSNWLGCWPVINHNKKDESTR